MIRRILNFSFLLFLAYNGCQKELSTSPEDVLMTRNALIVSSNPSGAKIYVDGKNTGQYTPDTLFWLKPGNLKITLKLNLFKDTSVTIYKNPSDTQSVFLDYTTNPNMFGILNFDSSPRDVEIYLNDSSLNQRTPYETRKVLPGVHKVTFKKPGFWDQSKYVSVRTALTTYVSQNLTDTLTWINYDSSRSDIPTNYLTSLAIGPDYVKWIGSADAGLIKFDDKTWTVYNTSNSIIPDNRITSVHADKNNVKWVGTIYGLVRIEGDIWTLFNSANSGLPDNNITALSSDNNGRIWIGTMSGGAAIFDGSTWEVMNTSNSEMPSNQVNNILHENVNTWLCTSAGLLKISTFTGSILIRLFTAANDGMPNDNVRTVAVDLNNFPWIGFGTEGKIPGGSAVKLDRFWQAYVNTPSEYVSSIAIDKSNTKWFGNADKGLTKLFGSSWTYFTTNNSSIGSDRIFKVIIDQNGYKWMPSYGGGLIKYKGN